MLFVFEVESRDAAARGGVCDSGDIQLARLGSIAARAADEKFIVARGVGVVVTQRDFDFARVEPGSLALNRRGGKRVAHVEEGLHAHLDGEQDAQELVAAAVGAVGHGAREDVSQGKEALGELVVRAVEVEEREDDGLEGRGGGD